MRTTEIEIGAIFKDFRDMDKVTEMLGQVGPKPSEPTQVRGPKEEQPEPTGSTFDMCERCETAIQPEQGLCDKCRADSDNEILASFKGWSERNASNQYKGACLACGDQGVADGTQADCPPTPSSI